MVESVTRTEDDPEADATASGVAGSGHEVDQHRHEQQGGEDAESAADDR